MDLQYKYNDIIEKTDAVTVKNEKNQNQTDTSTRPTNIPDLNLQDLVLTIK